MHDHLILPKEYFYCIDGTTVVGPHTAREIAELLQKGALSHEAHFITMGETEWKIVGHFPDIAMIEASQKEPEKLMSVTQAAGERAVMREYQH